MDKNKKLLLLFIYYLIFMFSFYMAFQIRSELMGRREGIGVDIYFFSKVLTITSTDNAVDLKFIFYLVSILALMASIFMVYFTINYNYDVVKKEDPVKEKIDEIWGKEHSDDMPLREFKTKFKN